MRIVPVAVTGFTLVMDIPVIQIFTSFFTKKFLIVEKKLKTIHVPARNGAGQSESDMLFAAIC